MVEKWTVLSKKEKKMSSDLLTDMEEKRKLMTNRKWKTILLKKFEELNKKFFGKLTKLMTILDNIKPSTVSLMSYGKLALMTVTTIGCSNEALQSLNFPSQQIFKCCKLIPVMIGGVIIQKKTYNIVTVISCLCMSIGLIFFILTDVDIDPNFHIIGVLYILIGLSADAIIGNYQEKLLHDHKPTSPEIIFYSYSIGSVILIVIVILSNDLIGSLKFILFEKRPVVLLSLSLIHSFSGYCGLQAILLLINYFGALTTAAVTNTRKAFTIIISFVLIAKPFHYQYLWSASIVFLGIVMYPLNKQINNHLQQFLSGKPIERQRPSHVFTV
ncbi:hypothetical protein SNEBB_009521 [Seison nebaliae]|nr:hypothetical protein SNEBB_009521 [Seison nebaliae]